MKNAHILLTIIIATLIGACSGGGEKGTDTPRPPLKTEAALMKRLAELGIELPPDSSFVQVMPTASGQRFQFETPAGGANDHEDVIKYYETEFIGKLRQKGWLESSISTSLQRIITLKGETFSISNATPAVTAKSAVNNTFITHKWK